MINQFQDLNVNPGAVLPVIPEEIEVQPDEQFVQDHQALLEADMAAQECIAELEDELERLRTQTK